MLPAVNDGLDVCPHHVGNLADLILHALNLAHPGPAMAAGRRRGCRADALQRSWQTRRWHTELFGVGGGTGGRANGLPARREPDRTKISFLLSACPCDREEKLSTEELTSVCAQG